MEKCLKGIKAAETNVGATLDAMNGIDLNMEAHEKKYTEAVQEMKKIQKSINNAAKKQSA